jgi:hypothetical protein
MTLSAVGTTELDVQDHSSTGGVKPNATPEKQSIAATDVTTKNLVNPRLNIITSSFLIKGQKAD